MPPCAFPSGKLPHSGYTRSLFQPILVTAPARAPAYPLTHPPRWSGETSRRREQHGRNLVCRGQPVTQELSCRRRPHGSRRHGRRTSGRLLVRQRRRERKRHGRRSAGCQRHWQRRGHWHRGRTQLHRGRRHRGRGFGHRRFHGIDDREGTGARRHGDHAGEELRLGRFHELRRMQWPRIQHARGRGAPQGHGIRKQDGLHRQFHAAHRTPARSGRQCRLAVCPARGRLLQPRRPRLLRRRQRIVLHRHAHAHRPRGRRGHPHQIARNGTADRRRVHRDGHSVHRPRRQRRARQRQGGHSGHRRHVPART